MQRVESSEHGQKPKVHCVLSVMSVRAHRPSDKVIPMIYMSCLLTKRTHYAPVLSAQSHISGTRNILLHTNRYTM